MANTNVPAFTTTPVSATVAIATANSNRDGTGTLGTVLTAGANGARVDLVTICATVTTTAGVVRLYIQKAGAGTNYLLDEILVAAVTPSATVKVARYEWQPTVPLLLAATDVLKASTENAENFDVTAHGGQY